MRKVAERAFPKLLAITPERFNAEMEAMHDGSNANVKSGGLAKTSIQKTQSAARTFVWYHDLGRPDDIMVFGKPSEPKHDEGDMFTRDDVQALREHVTEPRNRAILEMFLNTGQRISAIQGLRIGDVDTEAGWFTLNTERDGLKGAAGRSERRPLFGAAPYLADWIDVHPVADDPEAYLFIGDLEHHNTKVDQPLCQGTIRRMLQNRADLAGVDKPVNPHNFRHYWTTIEKQDYGLNDEEIKLFLGHKRESNGLNITYNHSITATLLSNTERKIEDRDTPKEKPLTPDRCAVCEESLESHWRCCPVCGTEYGPG
jgi:integrase